MTAARANGLSDPSDRMVVQAYKYGVAPEDREVIAEVIQRYDLSCTPGEAETALLRACRARVEAARRGGGGRGQRSGGGDLVVDGRPVPRPGAHCITGGLVLLQA